MLPGPQHDGDSRHLALVSPLFVHSLPEDSLLGSRAESPQGTVCNLLHTHHGPSYLEVTSRRKGPQRPGGWGWT